MLNKIVLKKKINTGGHQRLLRSVSRIKLEDECMRWSTCRQWIAPHQTIKVLAILCALYFSSTMYPFCISRAHTHVPVKHTHSAQRFLCSLPYSKRSSHLHLFFTMEKC